ncbi:MAG: glycoside hydrolase family 5 protein [Lachnospiraceae bacterium]|nr:glycoside hydrolase family 5 protein [Lachnospiraceae bacterium]MDD6303711.1 glycoside hydrolase family 5 protein [Lachnospiraceae bacterium]HCJ77168.1 glycosyl hydrolase family 5 [Roseburia sp.]
MQKSKRWIGVLLAGMLLLSGCGNTKEQPETKEPVVNETEENMQKVSDTEAMEETEADTSEESKGEVNAMDKTMVGDGVAAHGALRVEGTQLVDKNGDAVQLKGVSTLGIVWFPQFVNKDAFADIKSWGGNTIRLAMYTEEYDGYLSGGNQEEQLNRLDEGIKAATDLDMYVIVDWHILSDGNPNQHKEEAKTFFDEMSAKYKDYDNVIYEICNEPNGGTTWEDIRSYAEEVIPVIRNHAKDAVIIVGTPTWSQDVDAVAAHPLEEENLMYACHYYAATHKQELRDKVKKALDAGTPVFISEYSICDASGNGGIDYDEAEKWAEFTDENQLSYIQWNLANKEETSSLIKSGCDKTSGWTDEDLTETGLWLKQRLSQ